MSLKKKCFILALLCLFLTACSGQKEKPARIDLDNGFYYAIGSKETNAQQALDLEYKKLTEICAKNIKAIAGNTGAYVWLKNSFTLSPGFKDQELSMLVPYLHFADQLYLNGVFIGGYGEMGQGPEDPAIEDAGLVAHLYDFPKEIINQEGENLIQIKVFSLGNGSITPGSFVGFRSDAKRVSENMTFWRTRVYIFLEGFMLCVFIFFLLIFIAYRQDRIYFYISFLGILSMFFFSGFFGGDIPWIGYPAGVTYLSFYKFTKCVCFFAMEYIFSLLIFDFLQMKHTLFERIIRCTYLGISVSLSIAAPNYYSLIKISHVIIWFSLVDVLIAVGLIFANAFKGQRRERARILLITLAPFLLSITADFNIKTFANNITLPYFSIFGWVVSVIICFIYFSTRYNRIAGRLEYLNSNLKKEVENQTEKLVESNRKLEHEREISIKDMHMASLVQQKFFQAPQQKFKHWDYAVCYEPLSEVSGDFYNFHYDGDNLESISIFDASGHGVAAGLVTMLSETVIRQVYAEGQKNHHSLAYTLGNLNKQLIQAKGDVENYLTGLALRIKEKKNGECSIDIASAAHPYPLLYKSDTKLVSEILPPIGLEGYGPIGLEGIETKYIDFTFDMKKGDILVLFSDGLTETMNQKREEFGKERIGKILMQNSRRSASVILSNLMDALNEHSDLELRSDDLTVIILKRK